MQIEGNKVIIEFNPDSKERSKSGKSILLASSKGFIQVGDIKVSYNIIREI